MLWCTATSHACFVTTRELPRDKPHTLQGRGRRQARCGGLLRSDVGGSAARTSVPTLTGESVALKKKATTKTPVLRRLSLVPALVGIRVVHQFLLV